MSKTWRPPPHRYGPMHDTRPFWLFNLFSTLAIATVSYFVAIFVFMVLTAITKLPSGPLWDESLRLPFLFIMMMVVTGIIAVPYFQKEWDASLRTFSMFSATFIIAYAVFHETGYLDADLPLRALMQYVVDPLRHSIGK